MKTDSCLEWIYVICTLNEQLKTAYFIDQLSESEDLIHLCVGKKN